MPSQVEVYTLQSPVARAAIFKLHASIGLPCARARLRVRKLFLIETPKAGIMEKRHPSPQPVPTVPDP